MISEIRVKTRAASMDLARDQVELMLQQASQVAALEGWGYMWQPQEIVVTEVFGRDPWTEQNGTDGKSMLRYEGRGAIRFDPLNEIGGGIRLYGYKVTAVADQEGPDGPLCVTGDPGQDITQDTLVIQRINPVVHDHVWGSADDEESSDDLTADEYLAKIRGEHRLRSIKINTLDSGGWEVKAEVIINHEPQGWIKGNGDTLRDATKMAWADAQEALAVCGIE
jgi:hypothetical protein